VLYTLDAERYYHPTVAVVRFLAEYGHAPPMIVVGIPNTDRRRDFSYSSTSDDPVIGADRFLKFMEEELIPFIDNTYRTTPYRIIKGWCATGVFCIHALFTRPGLFDATIASSPYLVEDASFIFQLVEDYPQHGLASRQFLYMTVGGRDRPDAKVEVPRFAALLKRKELKGLDWHFVRLETEDHYTIDLRTSHSGLETLFSELIHVERMIKDGPDHAKKKLNALAELYGFDESLPEETLVRMGYVLLNQERFEDAVTLFQINAECYPDSYLSYENLGEAYMMTGQKERALQNFQKSLDLNPANEYARQKLKELNE